MHRKLDASSLNRKMKFNARKVFGSSADFEMAFFEGVLAGNPDNVEAIEQLAHLYTRKGLYAKGLQMDLKLSLMVPESPVVFYNLACSYALLGRNDEAFAALDRAVRLGWTDRKKIETDPDLASLRDDPRLRALLTRLAT